MALIANLLGQIAIGVSILLILHLLWHYVRSPLKNIPGPFLAKFTNLWRLFHVLTGHAQRTQKQLHDRYGSAVRLGPNLVTLSDPRLVKVVYDARGKFLKVSPIHAGPDPIISIGDVGNPRN
jgi:Gpi18-like mannosyltransferase